MQIGFKTDKGNKRKNNEDALFVMPEEGLYMVADGVGGHNSGELASRTAVASIAEFVKSHPIDEITNEDDIKGYFLDCLRSINLKVFSLAQECEENAGMATTLVMVYIANDCAYMINVGDSRGYIVRDGMMEQITEDHTYVNELVKNGTITPEEVEVHPQRNMITRALGGERSVNPDFYKVKILKNDVVCLCSDGLYNEVPKEKICKTITEADTMNQLVNQLVIYANENGGHDNITIVCIRI